MQMVSNGLFGGENLTEGDSEAIPTVFGARLESRHRHTPDPTSRSGDSKIPTLARCTARKHLCTLFGYQYRTIFSVHWSSHDREGIIARGAADDTIHLFVESQDGLVDGTMYTLLSKTEKAHDMDISLVQWSSAENGLLVSSSDDDTIKIWKLAF